MKRQKIHWSTLRMMQEKATGLFFDKDGKPDTERDNAWLFNEHQLLAVIRTHYGSDHGADLVILLTPEALEFARWCGRRGGSVSSPKKRRSSPLNGKQPKRKRITEEINVTT